jgi:quercetin dioxygenase-like cupin family protein
MITRRDMMKALAAAGPTAILASQLISGIALSQEGTSSGKKLSGPGASDKGVTVLPILQHDLPDAPGKQLSVVTVEFAPGAASSPHRHPGSVAAYVLEGSVVSQVDPDEPVTYKKGQAWYELPMHVHRVARNASKTRPAKIIAFLVSEKGQPLVLPAT